MKTFLFFLTLCAALLVAVITFQVLELVTTYQYFMSTIKSRIKTSNDKIYKINFAYFKELISKQLDGIESYRIVSNIVAIKNVNIKSTNTSLSKCMLEVEGNLYMFSNFIEYVKYYYWLNKFIKYAQKKTKEEAIVDLTKVA